MSDAEHAPRPPSAWVVRFAGLAPPDLPVLDVAAGAGRHSRLFLDRSYSVTAVDIDVSGLDNIAARTGAEIVEADLEDGGPWPFAGRSFGGIVVTDYLYRPILPLLAACLAPGGVLIYETFAEGNAAFGRPKNPDFLLRPNELLEAFEDVLQIVAFEQGLVQTPRPAARQRLCATKADELVTLEPE